MLSEQTHHKLVAMKFHGLAEAFKQFLDEPQNNDLSFEERFGLMVDREYSDRQDRRLKRRINSANFRYYHTRDLPQSLLNNNP